MHDPWNGYKPKGFSLVSHSLFFYLAKSLLFSSLRSTSCFLIHFHSFCNPFSETSHAKGSESILMSLIPAGFWHACVCLEEALASTDRKLQGSHCLFLVNWSTSLSGSSFCSFGEDPSLLLTLCWVAEEIQITFIRPPDGFPVNWYPNTSLPLSKWLGLNAFRCHLLYILTQLSRVWELLSKVFSYFSLIFDTCCFQVTELRPVKFGYGSKAFRPSRG